MILHKLASFWLVLGGCFFLPGVLSAHNAPLALVGSFLLSYDVLGHEIVNHVAIVSLRSDWDSGLLAAGTEIVGTVRSLHSAINFNWTEENTWQGFRAMVALGMRHFAQGTDHVLFLLMFLLPAPLLAHQGRWSGYGGFRHALLQLGKIVSAFTVGHSLSMFIGAAGWVRIPSHPIELLIAASILISALHAWRPLFPGKELFVAGSFGLVHGMALAAVLSDFHFSPWRTAFGIFGFNLGMELVQLAVVAATIPWLVLLSRTILYTPLKTILVVVAAVASIAWLGERTCGWTTPVTSWIEVTASHAKWLLIGLAFLASLSCSGLPIQRRRRRAEVLRYYF